MEQIRFTNGYITYTDRLYKSHGVNEIYNIGNGYLGRSGIDGYAVSNTPFDDFGNGFSETWDTSVCHSLLFRL